MDNVIQVCVEKLSDDIELPKYSRQGDAGMDIRASVDVVIAPGETIIVPTGLKFAIPVGYEIQVRPRSGLSLSTKLRIANSPGTIDTGYRGELGIIINNTSSRLTNNEVTLHDKDVSEGTYIIKKGDRIAQIVLAPIYTIEFLEVPDVSDIGFDRGGGLGSTGVN